MASTKRIKCIDDIYDLGGGTMKLAIALDVTQNAVWNWKQAGVPRKHWPALVEMFDLNPSDLYEIDEDIRNESKKP